MITLNYYGASKATQTKGFDCTKLTTTKAKKIITPVFNNSQEMTGWANLPAELLATPSYLANIKAYASYVQKHFQNFVVLGIGGSALGTKSLFHAFTHTEYQNKKINCMVLDNIDPNTLLPTLETLKLGKTMFAVVSKSGGTSETLFQLQLVRQLLQANKIKNWQKHFVIISEHDSALSQFATTHKIAAFSMPKNVGGRFSVFSAVGLLPASVFGIDIEQLLLGASAMQSLSSNVTKPQNNIAFVLASLHYHHYLQQKNEYVVMPYSNQLQLVADYVRQIWAESLGKDNQGQTPLKAIGATDQHSQLQLYAQGPNNKLIGFLHIKQPKYDVMLANIDSDLTKLFQGVSLQQLLTYELQSTAYSLTQQERPNYTLTLDTLSPYTMGELLYLYQSTTAFMGQYMQINTYNQPGVEQSKQFVKALLKQGNYKSKQKEITTYLKASGKFNIS